MNLQYPSSNKSPRVSRFFEKIFHIQDISETISNDPPGILKIFLKNTKFLIRNKFSVSPLQKKIDLAFNNQEFYSIPNRL